MRFEESVNRYVARFPELALYRRGQTMPRVSFGEIRRGIARGRELHGKFCRQVIDTVLARPLVSTLELVRRAMAATAGKLRAERMRLATIRSLAAMDDRMLRDIGIGRGNIPYIAGSLAYGERRGSPAQSKAIPAREAFLTMRAA